MSKHFSPQATSMPVPEGFMMNTWGFGGLEQARLLLAYHQPLLNLTALPLSFIPIPSPLPMVFSTVLCRFQTSRFDGLWISFTSYMSWYLTSLCLSFSFCKTYQKQFLKVASTLWMLSKKQISSTV
jgi:hypothetical protein